jgi:Acyl-CoA reductase (LuxC)
MRKSDMSPSSANTWPGYWLPVALRTRLVSSRTKWEKARFVQGRECGTEFDTSEWDSRGATAVTARWPRLTDTQWAEMLDGLHAARDRAPQGAEYWSRLQSAFAVAARRLADQAGSLSQFMQQALPSYTGYSAGMVAATLGSPDLWDLQRMASAFQHQPNKACSARWQRMPGLQGRIRFFPSDPLDRVAGWMPVAWEMPLYRGDTRPRTVVAYGAGDVPGSSLMMVVLALSSTLRGEVPSLRPGPPPVVLLCNSRREPLLAPQVLSVIEEVDPELVSMVAVAVWDHDDGGPQRRLLSEADLVLATAGDEVIADLSDQIDSLSGERRFRPHGRKVSFSVIGREALEPLPATTRPGWSPPSAPEPIEVVALLAGLDSAFWDQSGCLSSRVHFVEKGGPADDIPAEYARRLTGRMRQMARIIPRGTWPLRHLHDPFDRYKALEGSSRWGTGLQVMSEYDDPFVVLFDERTDPGSRLNREAFASLIAECRTRVIVVRTVSDIMEVPWRYLELLPRRSLQSLSVAVGRPGEGLTRSFMDFATACAVRGVTTIRTVGKGAFPQLAYSWDGFLPLDLVGDRPRGYFTTIEFDSPYEEMMQTYASHLERLSRIPARFGRYEAD